MVEQVQSNQRITVMFSPEEKRAILALRAVMEEKAGNNVFVVDVIREAVRQFAQQHHISV